MNKIIVTKEQYNKLNTLKEGLPVEDETLIEPTAFENVMSAKFTLDALIYELETLKDVVCDVEAAIYDRELDPAIEKMGQYAKLVKEIKEDTKTAENQLAGTITRFTEAVTLSEFTVTVSNEQIKQALDENFNTETSVMSVGYKDGEFALIFGEDEETIILPPFVFAKGKEENYDEAQSFIETFLDLENGEDD